MKTLEERKAILEAEIIKQQKKGWLIANRTDTTCQLTKEKKPETCLIVILFLLFVSILLATTTFLTDKPRIAGCMLVRLRVFLF